MDPQIARFHDLNPAMGSDDHVLPLHVGRRSSLELDLFTLDSVRGQFPADSEEAARRLDTDLLPPNRPNLRRPSEIDVDLLGLQAAIDANGTAGSEFLGLHVAAHLQGAARRQPFCTDSPAHLQGAARLNLLRGQAPRDADRSRRSELFHVGVYLEDAAARNARDLGDQRALAPRAA